MSKEELTIRDRWEVHVFGRGLFVLVVVDGRLAVTRTQMSIE